MDKFIHWLGDCHQRRRQKNLDSEEESCHLELGPCACPDHDPIAELEQWQAYVVEQQQEQDMTEEVTETAHGSSSDDDDEEQEVNLEDVEKGLTTSTTTKETYAHSPGYYHDDDTNRLSDEVEKGLTASTTTKETHIHSGECSRDNDLNCLSEEALKKSIQEKEKENNKLVHMGLRYVWQKVVSLCRFHTDYIVFWLVAVLLLLLVCITFQKGLLPLLRHLETSVLVSFLLWLLLFIIFPRDYVSLFLFTMELAVDGKRLVGLVYPVSVNHLVLCLAG